MHNNFCVALFLNTKNFFFTQSAKMSHIISKELIENEPHKRILKQIINDIQKQCAEGHPLPSIVSIYIGGDYGHNCYCRTFGRWKRGKLQTKKYLPSKQVLYQLFDHNFEPFQIYVGETNVLYKYNEETIKYIINNLSPMLLLKTCIIYHEWLQQKSQEISSINSKNDHNIHINPIYTYFINNNIIQYLMHNRCDVSSKSFFQTMQRDTPGWINYYIDSTSDDLPDKMNKLWRAFSSVGCMDEDGWFCEDLRWDIITKIENDLLKSTNEQYKQRLSNTIFKSQILKLLRQGVDGMSSKYYWPYREEQERKQLLQYLLWMIYIAIKCKWNEINDEWRDCMSIKQMSVS